MSAELLAKIDAAWAQLTAPGAPFETAEQTINGRRSRVFKNAPQNLIEMLAPARKFGEREFVVLQQQRWSFDRLFAEADALASQLARRFGVEKGDRVAIAMRNRPEWMAAFLAAASLGAIVAPLNSWGRREELLHGLNNSAPKVYFCDPQRFEPVAGELAALGISAVVTDAGVGDAAAASYEAMIAAGAGQEVPAVHLVPEDPALILYTSGTTSRAKGALSTQRAVCQALSNYDFQGALAGMTSPDIIQAMIAAGYAPTTLMAVPLFHVSGLQFQFLAALRTGRRLVMTWKWDPEEALRLIAAEHCTAFNGSPAMILQLLSSPSFAGTDTSSLSAFGLGGSAVAPRVIDLIRSTKPKSLSGTGYGLTETNGLGASSSGAGYFYKPGSSGQVSPIIEIASADAEGRFLPRGQSGEIWLRGPTVMLGYWRDPEATAAVMHDGWFASGDIGYVDAEGFIFIVDRIKDIVNRAGEKISTNEVEACLISHAAVAEVAAFGVPDETLGEVLAAVVHLRPGAVASEVELVAHVAQRLASFKVPAHIIITADDLPRSPSGKLLKRELRASVAKNFSQG
ncbi:MAG: acyl--CoA ligase [Betaproteobacteria bacterium]|nr:acyl--CoA ligase [Betaproteobacteria bacterium]